VNPANVVSVGASGAIMALLAAGVVVAFRIPAHHRGKIQGQLLRVLIPSLLPIATMSGDGGSIDYGAHLGGAVVGVLLGWLLLRTWPSPADADLAVRLPAPFPAELADAPDAGPRFRRAAQLLTAGGILLFALGFLFVQRGYPKYVDIAAAAAYADALVPDDQLASLKGSPEAVRALAEKYPRDPRALFMHGAHSIDAGDLAGGKALMRRALADRELLRLVFADRKLEITIRGVLIEVLLSEDDRAQAEAIAAPICQAGPGGTIPETLLLLDVCK
jgi:rhomboid protease GluP